MTAVTHIFKGNRLARLFRGSDDIAYCLIHPLYDEPEEKCDPEALGPLHLSVGERWSLYALRGYLVLMLGLAGYRWPSCPGCLRRTWPADMRHIVGFRVSRGTRI